MNEWIKKKPRQKIRRLATAPQTLERKAEQTIPKNKKPQNTASNFFAFFGLTLGEWYLSKSHIVLLIELHCHCRFFVELLESVHTGLPEV